MTFNVEQFSERVAMAMSKAVKRSMRHAANQSVDDEKDKTKALSALPPSNAAISSNPPGSNNQPMSVSMNHPHQLHPCRI